MMGLSRAKEIMISVAVYTQSTNVTDGRMDRIAMAIGEFHHDMKLPKNEITEHDLAAEPNYPHVLQKC